MKDEKRIFASKLKPHFMKLRLLLALSCGSLLLLTSCKSYSKTAVSSDIHGPTVIQKPVVADLDVQEKKVSGTATAKGSKRVSELKEMALNDALTKANADVLIEPRYEISTSGNNSTVTVTGYPATYKNFRPMEPADTMFIQKRGLDMETGSIQPTDKSHKRARRRRIAGLSVGSFFGAFLIAGIFAWIF